MSNKEHNPNAKSPFVKLEYCNAIVNDLDYDSNGRLTYMPYNGVDCPKDCNNKVISTPDPATIALNYTNWCENAINGSIFNFKNHLKSDFADSALSNIEYIITNRLRYEIATAAITVLNASTRALMLTYIIDYEAERRRYEVLCNELWYFHFNNLFHKDKFDERGVPIPDELVHEYISEADDVIAKSCRIISFMSADIANIISRYIYDSMNNLDITRFATESIDTLGLERDMVSKDNDYPYVTSILNESAYNDCNKIIELVELLVNHAYYVFCKYHKEISSKFPKLIEDKSETPQITQTEPDNSNLNKINFGDYIGRF
jgi:hypothetical protein